MIIISKRIEYVMGIFIFLLLTMAGVISQEQITFVRLTIIVLKAFIGYVIFWLLGIFISDILLKTILHSVEDHQPKARKGSLLSDFGTDKNGDLKKIKVEWK